MSGTGRGDGRSAIRLFVPSLDAVVVPATDGAGKAALDKQVPTSLAGVCHHLAVPGNGDVALLAGEFEHASEDGVLGSGLAGHTPKAPSSCEVRGVAALRGLAGASVVA